MGPMKRSVDRPAPEKLVPIKIGYADALCRGITRFPKKDGALQVPAGERCGWSDFGLIWQVMAGCGALGCGHGGVSACSET